MVRITITILKDITVNSITNKIETNTKMDVKFLKCNCYMESSMVNYNQDISIVWTCRKLFISTYVLALIVAPGMDIGECYIMASLTVKLHHTFLVTWVPAFHVCLAGDVTSRHDKHYKEEEGGGNYGKYHAGDDL